VRAVILIAALALIAAAVLAWVSARPEIPAIAPPEASSSPARHNELWFPLSWRPLIALWKAFYLKFTDTRITSADWSTFIRLPDPGSHS
jgi:hypothetical protein